MSIYSFGTLNCASQSSVAVCRCTVATANQSLTPAGSRLNELNQQYGDSLFACTPARMNAWQSPDACATLGNRACALAAQATMQYGTDKHEVPSKSCSTTIEFAVSRQDCACSVCTTQLPRQLTNTSHNQSLRHPGP